MSRVRKHATYANVVATLSLFLVIGGGSAAAAIVVSSNSQVASNTISGHHPPSGKHANIIGGSVNATDLASPSVTNAKLAPGSVTGNKVKNDSLTGNDIDESTLGSLPQAGNANTLDSLDSTNFGVGIMGGFMDNVGASATGNRPPIGFSAATDVGSFMAPGAGSFVARDLRVVLSSNNGAGQTRTFAFQKAGAPTALTCTVPENSGSCTDTVDTVTVNPGNAYAIAQTGTTGSPGTTDVQFGWRAVSP